MLAKVRKSYQNITSKVPEAQQRHSNHEAVTNSRLGQKEADRGRQNSRRALAPVQG